MRCVLYAWLLAGLAPGIASGQTTGRIAGTVRHPSGGAIAGALVTAISVATAQPWKAKIDRAWEFRADRLDEQQPENRATGGQVQLLIGR